MQSMKQREKAEVNILLPSPHVKILTHPQAAAVESLLNVSIAERLQKQGIFSFQMKRVS
jgi:hypothetical protein